MGVVSVRPLVTDLAYVYSQKDCIVKGCVMSGTLGHGVVTVHSALYLRLVRATTTGLFHVCVTWRVLLCVQSLWTGDKSGYKWGKRQPVRRRRGDVHGDLSAIVMRLDWQGKLTLAFRHSSDDRS